jgi:hypothetical protein
VGCERVRGAKQRAKQGAVVSRPGTRVDGYSSQRAKKLVLKVSEMGKFVGCRGSDRVGYYVSCICCDIHMICKYNEILVFRLKINHA